MSIKRAALYIRVSSDEQARHGLSLGEQRADLMNYAHEHGYAVIDVYADEGTSARKAISRRHQLLRLLDDVRAGKVDVILLKCLDRWSRNIRDYCRVQEILEKHGVEWECTQEDYNTTTASGRMLMHFKLVIAQHESDQTSERIRYVFEGKKKRHEVLTGNMPFGYKVENKHAVPDENAPVMQFMFEHVYHGGSVRSAVQCVYKEYGIALTYRQALCAMRNRAYIGERHGLPDYFPALVSHDMFQRVQELLSQNVKAAPTGRIYLFSGLIVCPDCGRILGGNRGATNSKGEYYRFQYRCVMCHVNGAMDRCNFKRAIFEDTVENYLVDNIQRLIADHIYTVEQYRIQQEKKKPKITIADIEAKMERLKDLYVDGMIDKATYKADHDKLNVLLAEISLQETYSPPVPIALREIVAAADFKSTYNELTRENKQRFWKSIISRITFEDTPESRGRGGKFVFNVEFL